jgi:peptidoglycan/xylan/chitin deacetylase (PgdA/CDA1 family)
MRDIAYNVVHGTLGSVASLFNIFRPTILCLHSVSADGQTAAFRSRLSISTSFLTMLAHELRQRQVPVIHLGEAVARLRNGNLSPFVVLTFDDGYRDNYDALFPIAREFDLPFTIFVTSGLVDRTVPMWWDTLERVEAKTRRSQTGRGLVEDPAFVALAERFRRSAIPDQHEILEDLERRHPGVETSSAYERALTWPMLREMAASGLATIGAHTATHRMLSSLSETDITFELDWSRNRIEQETGIRPRHLAYPFGQPSEVGPDASNIARRLGFEAAFTTEARPLAPHDSANMFHLPRILLSSKARRRNVAFSYISGLAALANSGIRRSAAH